MKTLKCLSLTLVAIVTASLGAQAQLAYFDSGNTVNPAPTDPNADPYAVQYVTPTYDTAGIGTTTVSNLTLGSGVQGTNLYHYGFGLAVSTGAQPTLAGAETHNAYIGFTITPTTGFSLNLTSLDLSGGSFFSQDGEADQATRTLVLESSVNGFTTQSSLGSVPVPANAFTAGVNLPLGSAFSNLTTPTEFRLYIVDPDTDGYESVTARGADFLSIDGTSLLIPLAPTPEPATYALLGGGLALLIVLRRRALQA